jgi:HEAT repeat protein
VLPVLVRAWRDADLFTADEDIRSTASTAIGEIGREVPGQVLPLLLTALESEDEELVCGAMRSLTVMSTNAEGAVAGLMRALADRREGVRNFAGWKLRELGPAAVPSLIRALGSDDPELRWRAAWVLGGMEQAHALPARQALVRAQEDDRDAVRQWASWACNNLGFVQALPDEARDGAGAQGLERRSLPINGGPPARARVLPFLGCLAAAFALVGVLVLVVRRRRWKVRRCAEAGGGNG